MGAADSAAFLVCSGGATMWRADANPREALLADLTDGRGGRAVVVIRAVLIQRGHLISDEGTSGARGTCIFLHDASLPFNPGFWFAHSDRTWGRSKSEIFIVTETILVRNIHPPYFFASSGARACGKLDRKATD